MKIRELTVQQYVYFVRFIDTEEGVQERNSQIERQIEGLRQWMEGVAGNAIEGQIATPPHDRNISRELFRTDGWLEKDGGCKAYSFEARAHSDATIVQAAYYRQSEGEPLADLHEMRRELWNGSRLKPFREASYFLGETIVLCALTEQAERTTAQALLNAWVDAPDEPHPVSQGCDIGLGTLYFDTSEPNTWVLLYPQQTETAASTFLNNQFPLIELHRQKCDAQVCLYEQFYRPALEGLEKLLRAELDATEEPTTKFRELQRRTLALSHLQQRYTEALGELEKIQTTVEINLRNLNGLIERTFQPVEHAKVRREPHPPSLFKNAVPSLFYEVLLEPYQQAVEQVACDRRYFEVADQRATVAREILQTLVEVERGETERFITYLLFWLSMVFAASQVIDTQSQTTLVRLLIIGIGVLLLGVGMSCYRFFQRRSLKKFLKWLFGRSAFKPPGDRGETSTGPPERLP